MREIEIDVFPGNTPPVFQLFVKDIISVDCMVDRINLLAVIDQEAYKMRLLEVDYDSFYRKGSCLALISVPTFFLKMEQIAFIIDHRSEKEAVDEFFSKYKHTSNKTILLNSSVHILTKIIVTVEDYTEEDKLRGYYEKNS